MSAAKRIHACVPWWNDDTATGSKRAADIGLTEVVADEKQGAITILGESVGEAVAIVEFGTVPALSELGESLTDLVCELRGHRNDVEIEPPKKVAHLRGELSGLGNN